MDRNLTSLVCLSTLGLIACQTLAPLSPPEAAPTPPEQPAAPPPAVEPAPDEGIVTHGALLAPMPTAVTSFGMATVDGAVYIAGGYHGEPHDYSSEGQSHDLWRLSVEEQGAWTKVGTMDAGLQGLALVPHDGRVCRFGGNRIQNEKGEPAKMLSVDEASCFDTTTRQWAALPAMPKGRSSHEAAILNGTVYVAGGWQMGEDGKGGGSEDAVWHTDVVALDLNDPSGGWKSIAVPFERRAVGVAAAAGKLVVIGGLTSEREPSTRVDVLDPATGQWTQGADFPADAFGVAAVADGNSVLASARDGVVHRYDVAKNAWSRATTLAFPRFFHRLAVVDGDLVAIGGITAMQTIGRTRHTERVPLNAEGATMAGWEMPFPGTSKNRQGLLLHHDKLYMFGGNNSLGQHDFEPDNFLAEGWRFHLPSMKFERVADFPAKRQTMQTVVVEGESSARGIAVGGFGHDGKAAVSHPEAFTFDFETETWESMGKLPRGRTQFGLAAHDGNLWMFGGLNYDPSRKGKAAFDHVTNVLISRAGKNSFEEAGINLPGPRRAFGGAVHGDDYVITGGMKENFQLVDGCLSFSFTTKKFSEIPCPSKNRLSAELVSLGGRLYVAGGSVEGADGKMQPERSVEVYDPKTKTWSVLVQDVGFDPKHMSAMAYHHRLALVSTHQEAAKIRVTLIDPGLPPL